MKRTALIFCLAGGAAFCLFSAGNAREKTMVVQRCLATDGKGRQCVHPAETGEKYCWRHCKAVRAVSGTLEDADRGVREAWQATKRWSTNAWRQTKSGAKSALDGTKDAAEEARVGIIGLFGVEDGK